LEILKMKKIRKIIVSFIGAVLTTGLALNFSACNEQSPLQPSSDGSDSAVMSLAKKGGKGKGKGKSNTENNEEQLNFPITISKTYRFNKRENEYRGGDMEFSHDNKSKFQLQDGALTPPSSIDWREPVTITMEIDYDEAKNELIYTFGPHGCQFEPEAQIKLDYAALGVELPVLYYIDDNGNYIEQTPEYIEVNKKWLKISVDHFSRYAVAWSN
jgi:hypothetical protein